MSQRYVIQALPNPKLRRSSPENSEAIRLPRRSGIQLEVFMDAEVDQDTLKWLNWCRLYLQVSTVADICTADGKFIRQAAWEGRREQFWRQDYNWPRTARPTRCHWETWRSVLTSTLLGADNTQKRLRQPLGDWTDDIHRWLWLFSPSQGLFHLHGHIWRVHHPLNPGRRSRQYKAHSYFWDLQLPPDIQRATVHRSHHGPILLTGTSPFVSSPHREPPSVLRAWSEAERQCTEHYGWVPDENYGAVKPPWQKHWPQASYAL